MVKEGSVLGSWNNVRHFKGGVGCKWVKRVRKLHYNGLKASMSILERERENIEKRNLLWIITRNGRKRAAFKKLSQ